MQFFSVLCFVWNTRDDEHVWKPSKLGSMSVTLNCLTKNWTGNS